MSVFFLNSWADRWLASVQRSTIAICFAGVSSLRVPLSWNCCKSLRLFFLLFEFLFKYISILFCFHLLLLLSFFYVSQISDIHRCVFRAISLMSWVFSTGLGDRGSIPGRIIPKTQKWHLMPPCLILSFIR